MSILFDIGADLEYRKRISQTETTEIQIFFPNQKLEGRTRERTPLLPTLSYLPSDDPEMSQLIFILYFLHTLNSYFLLICLISLSILIFILHIFWNIDFHLFIIFRHPPFAVRRSPSAVRHPPSVPLFYSSRYEIFDKLFQLHLFL